MVGKWGGRAGNYFTGKVWWRLGLGYFVICGQVGYIGREFILSVIIRQLQFMKVQHPGQLLDMTNVIREYVNRKKPLKRLMSKAKGPTIVIDLQERRKASSTQKSYETLQVKNQPAGREKLLPKESRILQSRNRNRSASNQIKPSLDLCAQSENRPQLQTETQLDLGESRPNHKSFRILKPRSKILAHTPLSLMSKKHCMSVDQTTASSRLIHHRYWIESVLRRGLTSTVYRCKDTLKQSQIALKVLNSVTETNQLRVLKYHDHPNLIKYQNYFINEDKLYFTMELYHCNLLQYMTQSQSRPDNREIVKDIFRQICSGINHLHNSDYAHTNLKLQHVLISRSEKVKAVIIDFSNLVKCKDGQKLPRKQIVRNPNYASPELVGGRVYNAKTSDCWALGIILYGLLTGRLPFRSKEQPELQRKIRKGKLCFPQNMNEVQRQLIQNILNVDEKERYTIRSILDSKWLN